MKYRGVDEAVWLRRSWGVKLVRLKCDAKPVWRVIVVAVVNLVPLSDASSKPCR